MPQTSLVDLQKAKAAISVLIWVPGITVQEAMILAKFSKEEASSKLMQRKVSRDAQKMAAKKGLLGDGTAKYQVQLLALQQANDIAVHSLSADGYKGSALKATIVEYPKTEMVTKKMSSAERLANLLRRTPVVSYLMLMLLANLLPTICSSRPKRLGVKRRRST
jgi:hypothetical protein